MTEQIKEMIEYCDECGNIEFELDGLLWGICCGYEMKGRKLMRSFWYFCNPDNEFVDEWGEYDTVFDIFNAKVFDGKSLIDLFDVADFSMN